MTIEGFEPRPKASQAVAAAKRARPGRPTHDTEPITPLARRQRYAVPFGVGAAVLIALMIGMASWQLSHAPAKPLQLAPTDAPAQAFGTDPVASSVAAQEARTATEAPERTISAYAAPDGALLGPIAADRQITPVAHYGSGWVAYRDGTGLVWVRLSDRPDLAIVGPDLAPQVAQPAPIAPHISDWTPPAPPAEPATGQKPADDRAAHHATAVAREHEAHGQKGP